MSGSCEPGVISGDMETAVLMRIKKLPGGSRGEAGEKSPFLSSEEAGKKICLNHPSSEYRSRKTGVCLRPCLTCKGIITMALPNLLELNL